MRRLPAVLLMFVATSVMGAEDPPKGDLGKLQGTWKGEVGPEKNIPVTIIIEGATAKATYTNSQGEEISLKGEIKLDEKATPKTIDFVNFVLPNGEKAKDNLGLYSLEADEWTVCNGG